MRVAVAALIIATLACGKDTTAPPPPPVANGTIVFTIGPTCVGTHQTYFEIDSSEVGPEMLAPSGVSVAYTTTAAVHATRARIAGYFGTSAALWTSNQRVTVPPNGSVNRLITC